MDKEALVFNLDKIKVQNIPLNIIKDKVGEANCTTMIIDGKEVEEKEETNKETIKNIAELLKTFGQTAIECGNLCNKLVEEKLYEK